MKSTDPARMSTEDIMAELGELLAVGYACWIRSDRNTNSALALVLSVGICGTTISYVVIEIPFHPLAIMGLTGIWILNGLGIVWIVQKVRRIRAASNTDAADAAR